MRLNFTILANFSDHKTVSLSPRPSRDIAVLSPSNLIENPCFTRIFWSWSFVHHLSNHVVGNFPRYRQFLTRALVESADAANQRDKLSGDHLMGDTWPWTYLADFYFGAMQRLEDHEGECPGSRLAMLAAGRASLECGSIGGAVDQSSREISIQQSPFSCFVFSASSHFQASAPQTDKDSLILTQGSNALREEDLHSGLASRLTSQLQYDIGLSFGTSQVQSTLG